MLTKYQKKFEVANPSSYERSDFVEVDLQSIGVPLAICDQKSLKLSRLKNDDTKEEIPYQIDYILGKNSDKVIMTFISSSTPPGLDDYSQGSAKFILEEDKPHFSIGAENLWVGHYYKKPARGEPQDGFNNIWYKAREVDGVKLSSNILEIYFSLVHYRGLKATVDYTGSATSIFSNEVGKMGSPYILSPIEESPQSRWGQITELVFFPLPWELKWFQRVSLLDKKYTLVL